MDGDKKLETRDTASTAPEGPAPGKKLSPAATRALQEAEARRREGAAPAPAKEIGGPKGEEPTRFGDWERGGRAVDF